MNAVIIDASVAAKLLFQEPETPAAERLFRTASARRLAPDLLPIELASVVRKRRRKGELTRDDAIATFELIASLPIELVPCDPLLPAAFEIALSLDRTVYDALYVAAAIAEGGVMVTSDARLVRSMQSGPYSGRVRLLDDVK